jgi:hypothetical protein
MAYLWWVANGLLISAISTVGLARTFYLQAN